LGIARARVLNFYTVVLVTCHHRAAFEGEAHNNRGYELVYYFILADETAVKSRKSCNPDSDKGVDMSI
jgi:hypothetical protein